MHPAINHLKQSDAVLRRLVERLGPYRIEYREPNFPTLVRSIVFQQLSGKAARTIFDRLVAACGEPGLTPESILRLRPVQMRRRGLSSQKTAYIRDLARRVRSGEIDFAALARCPDQEVIERLTRVKGIGVWTAHMFLIFALRRPDVLPVGDLGIRASIQRVYGLAELPSPRQIETLAQPWHPWCTVASWYLWLSLDNQAGL